ncbi:MAG: citramalate synthase, partial [Clostridia bacterium]|nr:citramalate synthase [Clostridia bacterium]
MTNAFIFDTTLRDGAQSVSVSFSINDKLKILKDLDRLGISFAECGMPGVSEKDASFFSLLTAVRFDNLKPVAFTQTHSVQKEVGEDANFIKAVENSLEYITICGKSSALHVFEILKTDKEKNLDIIRESVRYACSKGKKVFFDAEHFFDGFRYDREYALETIKAAAESGADTIVLCDTNGGMLTDDIYEITLKASETVNVKLGIHCHNDSGLAIANSIAAYKAGASCIQGTMCGIGERCGNTDLCTLIPDLQFKLGCEILSGEKMSLLNYISRSIADTANIAFNERSPYVGRYAFSHKAGTHIDGEKKFPGAFEHVSPSLVGNSRSILLSEQSGKAAAKEKLMPFLRGDSDAGVTADELLKRVKQYENAGYQFENADGSLALLILDILGKRRKYFTLSDIQIVLSDPTKSAADTKALMKITVNGESALIADEGDGPVNAMDKTLRKSLARFYPCLKDVKLTDYKVRVIDSDAATAAKVRVVIESSDGITSWHTIGVSTDIIEASYIALCDSLE